MPKSSSPADERQHKQSQLKANASLTGDQVAEAAALKTLRQKMERGEVWPGAYLAAERRFQWLADKVSRVRNVFVNELIDGCKDSDLRSRIRKARLRKAMLLRDIATLNRTIAAEQEREHILKSQADRIVESLAKNPYAGSEADRERSQDKIEECRTAIGDLEEQRELLRGELSAALERLEQTREEMVWAA